MSLLVCPACRGDLEALPSSLGCRRCALQYPVVDDVPWMVSEHARRWEAGPLPEDVAPPG